MNYPWNKTKKSKYNAKKTEIDGITFHSKKEADRYVQLKMLKVLGQIENVELQPTFYLHAPNSPEKPIGKCILDFKYWDLKDKKHRYEDVKGVDNPLSKWKRKHVEAQYNIKVEVI